MSKILQYVLLLNVNYVDFCLNNKLAISRTHGLHSLFICVEKNINEPKIIKYQNNIHCRIMLMVQIRST